MTDEICDNLIVNKSSFFNGSVSIGVRPEIGPPSAQYLGVYGTLEVLWDESHMFVVGGLENSLRVLVGEISLSGSNFHLKDGYIRLGGDGYVGNIEIQNNNKSLVLSGDNNEFFFSDNGQIRSLDNNHRILFRRSENKMELREYGDIIFSPGATTGAETAKAVILGNGNFGIGTPIPSAKLEVNGDIKVTGDIFLTDGADCAEDFDIISAESVEPGMVMVIDDSGALKPSQQAYDRRVAGVISGAGDLRPGITLDRQKERGNRLPIALTGKVYCKVDAEHSPIEVGDLLTSSSTFGHAMKVIDHTRSIGAIIGKALRPLKNGKGIIPILVALQ